MQSQRGWVNKRGIGRNAWISLGRRNWADFSGRLWIGGAGKKKVQAKVGAWRKRKWGKTILIGEHWVCSVVTPNGNFLKSVRVTLVRTPVIEAVESEWSSFVAKQGFQGKNWVIFLWDVNGGVPATTRADTRRECHSLKTEVMCVLWGLAKAKLTE